MAAETSYKADAIILLEAAEERRRAGRLLEARVQFLEAARFAETVGDPQAYVTATLGVGGIWVDEQRDAVARATFDTLLQHALTHTAENSLERARLDVRRAAEAVYQGASVEAVVNAAERVRGFGDDVATAEALSLLHHVQLGPRFAEVRLGVADEILHLGARANDPFLSSMGLCWRTVDFFLNGDPRAGQSLEELRERSEGERCDALGFVADLHTAMMLARAGRLESAEVAATNALERGTDLGDPDAPAYYGAMLAALRWWQGRAVEVIEFVRSISTSPRLGFNDHVYLAADAILSAVFGDFDSAEDALARVVGLDLGRVDHSSSWLTTQFLIAEAAYLLGDAEVAESTREVLAPYAHLPVMPSLGVVCFGSVERSLGLCAATVGLPDAAVHHLDAAIRVDRRLGNRPMATMTERTLADVLSARGGENDGVRAHHLALDAEERANRMVMVLPDPPRWLCAHGFASRTTGRPKEAFFQRTPGGWQLLSRGQKALLPNRVGFAYLAELIDRPQADVDALSLASQGLVCSDSSDAVADGKALDSYRRRAQELKELLGRADLKPSTAACCRQELDALESVLGASTGLGGRQRLFPDNAQRARTSVRKALVRAINEIGTVEPDLGEHLRASVETGITCRYSPTSSWRMRIQH